jgi:hypothetical protein
MESYIDKGGLFRYKIKWKSAICLTLMFNVIIDAAQPEPVRFDRNLLSTGQGNVWQESHAAFCQCVGSHHWEPSRESGEIWIQKNGESAF